jgi:D-3-phosphoglycerate dehydrogenase
VACVVLTDHAWPDVEVERRIIESAGHRLVSKLATATEAQVDEVVAEAQPAAILTCWAPVSDRAIVSAQPLQIVARMGVGLDNIGVAEATRQNVWVTNVPDYCVEEVSDHAIALALSWLRGVTPLDREVRAGTWNPGGARLARLSALTAGIIGYGRIGHRTAEKLTGLGMRVLALPPQTSKPLPGRAQLVPLEELMAQSDVVILHVPLTAETHHLVDAQFLSGMKTGAVLVNVSRGPVVDTAALLAALEHGPLGAAALDVIEGEPNPPRELVARPNVIVTPHVAFSSTVSILELRERACAEVVRVLAGEAPRHPCNQPRGVR